MDLSSLPTLESLRKSIQKLPGIGPKSAFRIAMYFMKAPHDHVEAFIQGIELARGSLGFCPLCHAFVEGEGLCRFCEDAQRTPEVVCVVEDPLVPLTLEAKHKATWKYHVTHGLISPVDEVFPEQLKLQTLWNKLPNLSELILSFSSSVEGEATATYLAQEITRRAPLVKISKIAHGIPFGARLDGVDQMTLIQALRHRQPIK
jgi:recombination protein RecR